MRGRFALNRYNTQAVLLFLVTALYSGGIFAQRIQVGGIFAIGSKSIYNEIGFGTVVRMANHFEANLGYSHGLFNGEGFTTGLTCYALKKRVRPFIGFEYSKSHGVGDFTLHYSSYETNVKIGPSEFNSWKTGVSIKIKDENVYFDGDAFWNFCLSYRFSNYSSSSVTFVDNNMPSDKQSDFIQRVGSGWGFCVGFTVLFNLDKKKDIE